MRLERLSRSHRLDDFDSGVPALDAWLRSYAGQAARAGTAVTYVALVDDRVVGYFAVAASAVAYDDAPPALAKKAARHPIPVIRLARLAVDRSRQGSGIGAALLREALRSAVNAADIIGARAVVVDAKDDDAAAFYRHFDFDPFPDQPHQLYLLMKDVPWRP